MNTADEYALRFSSSVLATASLIAMVVLCSTGPVSANSYYYKKLDNGVVHYTNIKPEQTSYKQMSSPWGTFRGTTKAQRKHVTSFKYKDNYDDHINTTAQWYGMDPLLVKAIIKVESNFNAQAVSPAGAMGMMQLMPGTALDLGVADVFDPVENIDGGVRYLSKLMTMFNNDLTLALAGYNAGENAVVKYGNKIPPYPETIDYVEKVYSHYDYLSKNHVKRDFKHRIAERFDKKTVDYSKKKLARKKKKASFIYVETVDQIITNDKVVSKKPAVSPAGDKTTASEVRKAANKVYSDSDPESSTKAAADVTSQVKPDSGKGIAPPVNTSGKNVGKAALTSDATPAKGNTDAKPNNKNGKAHEEATAKLDTSEPQNREGKYSIQIASFPRHGLAQNMERRLTSKTIPAYVQKVDIPDRGTWYRVKVGSFQTRNEASSYAMELKSSQPEIDSFLVTMN